MEALIARNPDYLCGGDAALAFIDPQITPLISSPETLARGERWRNTGFTVTAGVLSLRV